MVKNYPIFVPNTFLQPLPAFKIIAHLNCFPPKHWGKKMIIRGIIKPFKVLIV